MPTAPYGCWPSVISAELVSGSSLSLAWPLQVGAESYWCEGRPAEAGRVTLLRRDRGGQVAELTLAPFNLRSRINEYGGRPYATDGTVLVGCGFADQRLWRLDGQVPWPLTPESDGALRFGDLVLDRPRDRIIAVCEDHRGQSEPRHSLVAIPLNGGPMRELAAGPDFLAAPALSPDGAGLAWIAWNHPNMPWDATTLQVAALDETGMPGAATTVAGGPGESVVQPEWAPDGSLLYLSDRGGSWGIVRWTRGRQQAVAEGKGEIGGPLWQLGMRWLAVDEDGDLAAIRLDQGRCRLILLDGTEAWLDLPWTELADITIGGRSILLRAGAPDRPSAIIEVNRDTGSTAIVASAARLELAPGWLTLPEPITVEGPGGPVHALYYPPTNPDTAAPVDTLPPLIVRSHGGPTSRASSSMSLSYQFWTSRGFALVDVDYRGSSGYGRAYRTALNGRWGIADVEDCVAVARALVAQGRVDGKRLVIAGGSAGGYTTLAALAFTDVFAAGTSWYGIGDLTALAADTHKFESRYLDRLVGPWPEARATYEQRSPINHVDGLTAPVLFLQGLDDKVVPPAQAETMVAALRRKGIPTALLTFAGEGHGFRKAETVQAALKAEHAFYARVFSLQPAEDLPPLPGWP